MPPIHFSDDVEKKPLTWKYIRNVVGNFIHYYRPHVSLFWLSIGCALANSAFTILVPLLVKRICAETSFPICRNFRSVISTGKKPAISCPASPMI